MNCQLQAAVYDINCVTCMVRAIKMLRSPDKRLTLALQKGKFELMGSKMAELVKEALRNEG